MLEQTWPIGVFLAIGSSIVMVDKIGSNLSIIVKILGMDSYHLTDMGMEAKDTCMGLLAVLTTKKQSISNRISNGRNNLGRNLSIFIKFLTVVFDGWKAHSS
jgi:hypothetical protein